MFVLNNLNNKKMTIKGSLKKYVDNVASTAKKFLKVKFNTW